MLTNKIFRLSPLIRITLISLYGALTFPLPFLAEMTDAPIPAYILWIGLALGLFILLGALSEKVILTDEGISVTYPQWVPQFFRSSWSLSWSQVKELKLRTTGQGGIVYYFVTYSQEKAYLLPMRVAGFSRLVEEIEAKTGLDTSDIRPLAQPWMYLILLLCTLFLWLSDAWVVWTEVTLHS
jgi:hypothetical protein